MSTNFKFDPSFIKTPSYNEDGSIDVEINHPEFGWIPFTASLNDVESVGRNIHSMAKAGYFGEVLPHREPVFTDEDLNVMARSKRDGLFAELDAIAGNHLRWKELTEAEQDAAAEYRQGLKDVPQQRGYPRDINWPLKPKFLL